ncbi:MAG TPA: hypothetical protein VKG79_03835 [Bryobacteraceae bacterium]|nr:hypothetical protein [Bryobacteraceae bacterium]
MRQLSATLLLALLSASAFAQDGLKLKFGTWNLNLEKSTFAPGSKPRSDTRIYEDRGGGVIMSKHTTADQQGREALTIYVAKFDDKEYPVITKGSSAFSFIAFHRIDEYSESFVLTRDGKVAVRGTTTISKNGKTMTMILNRTNGEGQTARDIDIYEKR